MEKGKVKEKKEKPRVLVSLTYFSPNVSGVTIYADILARELVKTGHEVTVICSQNKKDLSKQETIEGVKIFRVRVNFALGKGVLMLGFPKEAWKQVKMADVVNCQLPQIESFILAFWAKILKKKLVITHHCEFGIDGPWTNIVTGILSYPFHLISYLLADRIVSYTEDYAKHSIFLRHFKKKTVFVLPPVLVEKTGREKEVEIGEKIGRDKDSKIIGYVGRVAWEKGLNFLLEALEKVNQKIPAKLVLVGPYEEVVGDNSYQKLKPLLEKQKDKVKLLGPLPHKEIGAFLKNCDLLVLPSTNNLETFGIVQAEAMIMGVPVVASNLPGVRVPVQLTGMGEIAKVGDSDDLAEKIIKVLKTSYSSLFSKKAQSIFYLERFVENYEEILRS